MSQNLAATWQRWKEKLTVLFARRPSVIKKVSKCDNTHTRMQASTHHFTANFRRKFWFTSWFSLFIYLYRLHRFTTLQSPIDNVLYLSHVRMFCNFALYKLPFARYAQNQNNTHFAGLVAFPFQISCPVRAPGLQELTCILSLGFFRVCMLCC